MCVCACACLANIPGMAHLVGVGAPGVLCGVRLRILVRVVVVDLTAPHATKTAWMSSSVTCSERMPSCHTLGMFGMKFVPQLRVLLSGSGVAGLDNARHVCRLLSSRGVQVGNHVSACRCSITSIALNVLHLLKAACVKPPACAAPGSSSLKVHFNPNQNLNFTHNHHAQPYERTHSPYHTTTCDQPQRFVQGSRPRLT